MEINEQVRVAAEKFASDLTKYPAEEQIAVATISKNVLNGCSWEFVRENSELKKNKVLFERSAYCRLYEVTYSGTKGIKGYMVYMDFVRLIQILNEIGMGVFNQTDLQKSQEHRRDAVLKCDKIMKSGYKGQIGIFCTNDSSTITDQGKTYPAFAITLNELAQLMKTNGYGMIAGDKMISPDQLIAKEEGVIARLKVAPSSNALYISIGKMA